MKNKFYTIFASFLVIIMITAPITAFAEEPLETKKIQIFDIYGTVVQEIEMESPTDVDITAELKSAFEYCAANALDENMMLTISMPAGEFITTKTNIATSNTILDMTSGTILYNTCSGKGNIINSPSGFYGYDGLHNFIMRGGVLTYDEFNAYGSCLCRFAHTENVRFEGVTFKDGYYSHLIEIAACKNMTFDGCVFDGFIPENNSLSCEALQIDILEESQHFSGFPVYDGTMNNSITVENCTFNDLVKGLGTRSYFSGKYQSNIVIRNNIFQNVSSTGIYLTNFRNVTIIDNYFDKCGDGIRLYRTSDSNVSNNEIYNSKSYGILLSSSSNNNTINSNDIDVTGNSSIVINSGCNNNTVNSNDISNSRKNGMLIGGATVKSISKNIITNSKDYAIQVNSKANISNISNNTFNKHGKYAMYFDKDSKAKVYNNNYKNSASRYAYSKGSTKDVKFANIGKPIITLTKSGKSVKVSWKKVGGASKYYIYRSSSKNGTYSLIGSAKSSSRSYTDKKLKKGKYYYKVLAVKNANSVKQYSSYSSIKGKTIN